MSASRLVAPPARLEQEPDPLFGLVDPVFQEARGRHIAVLVANAVRPAYVRCLHVVAAGSANISRGNNRHRCPDALQAGDMSDRAQRRAAELPHTLGYRVGSGVDLASLVI